ncbi:NADPH:quinone reductase-like Zn-dependent oxidoreductase [Phyllobacterium ifriqiyense]|uniref:NADPH:quinone reductase-like Zn-dependent oxidoreductase n=1 Tax=Phyllobacterium ifriqiyense TaxID=314238 RepID=A0ABU0S9G6_9HYPH|nr:NADP-dependent oxidoreductase [Phyllobacterium ifriqiyense]MDQ0996368.1 NADPH:quinone reductase-like Zn-dependent oxidoreductase [Phyllobacterium ifriqiyense]
MKALRIRGYNAAPVIEDVDIPEIGPSEVLVRVTATSLNPLDVKMQLGYMDAFFPVSFPYILGTDLAGTIERTGSRATHWRSGDEVIARVDPGSGGALAEFVIVPSDYLVRAPSSISLTDAAGLATGAGTAWQALHEMADLRPGQTVLVHAGAGGVGSFAIQLARSAGARVIATASGAGLDMVRRLGADQVIDYRNENFAEKVSDVDVVLDPIGGETQQASYGVLRTGGRLLATASPPDGALAKAHNVTATFVFHSSDASRLAKIVKRVDEGALKILVDSQVPLAGAVKAFEHQGSGRAKGKIIVSI